MLQQIKSEFAEERAIVFTLCGRLVWRSLAWAAAAPSEVAERALIGSGWLEFIFAGDVGRVCSWLVGQDSTSEIRFRSMAPSSGLPVWLRWVKARIGNFWVVLGDVRAVRHNPHASSCTSADPFAGGAMISDG